MPWQQLQFPLDDADHDAVEDALMEAGALSITLTDAADEPILEPGPGETPLWQHTILTALFEADADPLAALRAVQVARGWAALPDYRIEPLDDQDWTRAWMKDFKPMRFGERLWVVPSGFEAPEPEAVNLYLDPGLAFGTGTHPTTALCLQWLDAQDLAGKRVIDYGCGSGILAIAALKLGARSALGVDNDPQALQASRDNAERNAVAARLQTQMPGGEIAPVPVLVANILAGPLVELAPVLASLSEPGGQIALSGILAEQEAMIREAYAPFFALAPTARQDDWLLIHGRRS